MKIYTSEITQNGKTIDILGNKIKFDAVGCAEVEDKVAEEIMEYSNWYTKERQVVKIEPKKETIELEFQDNIINQLKLETEKLNKQIESRKNKIKALEAENKDIRKDMQKVINEKEALEKGKEQILEVHKKEVENLDYKFELALLDIEDLKKTCSDLGVDEKFYIKRKTKKPIIEVILKAAQ